MHLVTGVYHFIIHSKEKEKMSTSMDLNLNNYNIHSCRHIWHVMAIYKSIFYLKKKIDISFITNNRDDHFYLKLIFLLSSLRNPEIVLPPCHNFWLI